MKAPKVFLKRKAKDMRINLFNESILLAWKANLDIQIVLEPYGCVSYIVGYISKSQRGMSAQLDAAAKEARKGNLDLKKQVRHIGNIFSNCVEVSAQEAVYLNLQIPLTKCTRDIVFINTSVPEERIFLLEPKATLDELPAESTDVESDNVIQRYSKRPKQLSKFCLADYVSKVDIIYPKGNKLPEKVNDKNDDDRCDSSSSNESEDSLDDDNSQRLDLLYKTKNGTKYKKRKVPRIIRYTTVQGFFHQPAYPRGEGATIKRISPPRKPPAGGDCGGSAAFPRWVLQVKINCQSLPVFIFLGLRRGSAGG